MTTFQEANDRLLKDVWICMNCGTKQRSPKGKPTKCRNCGRAEFRVKHKTKKK